MGPRIYQLAVVVLAVALVGMIALFMNERSTATAARQRVNNFCGLTKTGLRIDAREIRTNGSLKQRIVQRVYNDDQVVDGVTALDNCLPTKFAIEKWVDCAGRGDDACMIQMLEQASDSIELL